MINDRIQEIVNSLFGGNVSAFCRAVDVKQPTMNTILGERKSKPSYDILSNIINAKALNVSAEWLLTGVGEMLNTSESKDIKPQKVDIETRPRIPFNAAAGTVSIALSGVSPEDSEQMPVIQAFANYSYTILVKGDSMEPEFHSGDELACLQLTNGKAKFIQWGRYHVLDTAQGVLVKRIYDNGEYILCKSENSELYPDFNIHKEDIYNLGLVIGMLRRF